MELKNYSLLLISVFSLNTLIACNEPEIVKPAEVRKWVENDSKVKEPFEISLQEVTADSVSFKFKHQAKEDVSYALRFRIAYPDGKFYLLGSGVCKASKKNYQAKYSYPIGTFIDRTKPHTYRAEVFQGGAYLGDYEVK